MTPFVIQSSSMKRDAMLVLRLPAEIKAALQKAADANLRSMSSMNVWALSEWLAAHGFLDAPGAAPEAKPKQAKRGGRKRR